MLYSGEQKKTNNKEIVAININEISSIGPVREK